MAKAADRKTIVGSDRGTPLQTGAARRRSKVPTDESDLKLLKCVRRRNHFRA